MSINLHNIFANTIHVFRNSEINLFIGLWPLVSIDFVSEQSGAPSRRLLIVIIEILSNRRSAYDDYCEDIEQ